MKSVRPIEFFVESSRIRAKRIRRLRKGEVSVMDSENIFALGPPRPGEVVCIGGALSQEQITSQRNGRYRRFIFDAFLEVLSSDLREVASELHAKRNAVPKSTKFVRVELGSL